MKFGTSGIRGVYGCEIGVSEVLELSVSVASLGKTQRFVVGSDTRDSCKLIAQSFAAGLSVGESEVGLMGVVPTPVLAFSTREGKYAFGLSCTASHNPPEFCGIKVFDNSGMVVSSRVERQIESGSKVRSRSGKSLIIQEEYLGAKYIEQLLKKFGSADRKFRILVDCANGAGALYTPRILSLLGHEVVSINSHLSSIFPGRNPEPIAKNLVEVSNLVRDLGVDFGLVHDGDADRLVLVKQDGVIVPDYAFSYIMLKIVYDKNPGNIIISINSSTKLEVLPKEMGFRAIRARLGKTFLELKRVGGVFATEPSKIVDPAWGLWEDGIYAAVMLTQYLSKSDFSLTEMLAMVPHSVYLQQNVRVRPFKFHSLKSKVLSHFESMGIQTVEEIDGLRVTFNDGSWILFRLSGTEPRARIYVESNDSALSTSLLRQGIAIYAAL